MQSFFIKYHVSLCNQFRRDTPAILESSQGSQIDCNLFRNEISHRYLCRVSAHENAGSQLARLLAHFIEIHTGIEKTAPLYGGRRDGEDRDPSFTCAGPN